MRAATESFNAPAAGLSADNAALGEGFLRAAPAEDVAALSSKGWVYRHVLDAIREGRLAAGTRLPSSRDLAVAWGVARGAVDAALGRLCNEGLLERRAGRGSCVAQRLPAGTRAPGAAGAPPLNKDALHSLRRLEPLLRQAGAAAGPRGANPDAPLLRAPSHGWLSPRGRELTRFPLAAWRRQLARVHGEADRASLAYGPPGGLPALQRTIASYLALTRDIRCHPDQVLLLNGQLQALDLVARVLLNAGDRVAVEDPGYLSIARSLALASMQVQGVAVDDNGLDVAALAAQAGDAALICAHPLSHFPTGIITSAARRSALLRQAEASDAWVVEGDHFGEIVHDGPAPRPLFSEDRGARVLHLGTFNTVLFPALRLHYLVLPDRLVDAFVAMRGMWGDHPPLATQQALAGFIDDGHLSSHLRVLRSLYRERRDAVRAAAAQHLPPPWQVGPMHSATFGCLATPPGVDDVALVRRLVAQGLAVEPLSAYRWHGGGRGGIVFGYGGDTPERIDAAFQRMAPVLASVLASVPASVAGPDSAAA